MDPQLVSHLEGLPPHQLFAAPYMKEICGQECSQMSQADIGIVHQSFSREYLPESLVNTWIYQFKQ